MIDPQQNQARQAAAQGQLLARLSQVTQPASTGLQPLGLGNKRDGLLYVPQGYHVDQPAPFVLMLHGATGTAHQGITPFLELADASGLILLAIDSREQTWDVIGSQYGPDVSFIDQALEQTFNRYRIDPKHVAVEGFSDGASYALSLGLINGDLFTHVIAFSPGFAVPTRQVGQPRFFISHGVTDQVLRIDACSRRIVPRLREAGYRVSYYEFGQGHTMPTTIIHQSIRWFITTGESQQS